MSIRQFASALKAPPNRLSQIVAGRRAITADTSLRQAHYELEPAKRESNRIQPEVKPRSAAA